VRAVVALGLAGGLLEVGCWWIWWQSPGLTAIYNPDYTRELFARLPWLCGFAKMDSPGDVRGMVNSLEVGLGLMSVGYVFGLVALAKLRQPRAWLVVGLAGLFRLTLAALPGLFSTDIFSYVMYGRIAAVYGQNPYLQPPAHFPDDAFVSWVFPFWRDQPSVYGPLWTDFSWLLSTLTGRLSNFDQVLAYRLSLVGLEVGVLGVLWWLLGRLQPERRVFGLAMFAWNPLVLFDLVGSSHNDVAMLALLLLGLVPFVGGSGRQLGIAMLTLSALVKYTTVVVVPFTTVTWAAQGVSRRARLARLGAGVATVAIVTIVLWWPWLQAPRVLASIGDAAGGRLVLNSTPDLVALTLADDVLVPAGMDQPAAQAACRFWVRAVTRAVYALYFAWELWRLWKRPTLQMTLEAATRALLILPLLVLTWVWSWYFAWSLALAVLLDGRSRLTRLVVTYTLVALPVVYAHQYLNDELSGALVLLFSLGPLLGLIRPGSVGQPAAHGAPTAGARG
jgi:hypothetical protein